MGAKMDEWCTEFAQHMHPPPSPQVRSPAMTPARATNTGTHVVFGGMRDDNERIHITANEVVLFCTTKLKYMRQTFGVTSECSIRSPENRKSDPVIPRIWYKDPVKKKYRAKERVDKSSFHQWGVTTRVRTYVRVCPFLRLIF